MLKKHRYIKNIDKIVKLKLKELKLRPLKRLSIFIRKNKRFYSTPCLKGKKKLFFKILIANELAPTEAIRREIAIIKFLNAQKVKINFPPLVTSDNKKFPYWYLTQYFEGKLLGNFYKLNLNQKKYIPLLVEALFSLQRISKKELEKISKKKEFFLWQRNFYGYLKMIKFYQREIKKELVKKIDFKKIYQLFEQSKKIFKKSPLVLSHGDFTLANFICTPGKLVVADWEQAHLDNFVYDLSHLWIQLWRYPDWQKSLISEFIQRLPKNKVEEFKNLFRIVIISEALGELRWSINLCDKKYKKGAIEAALKTIKAALTGFDNLISL
jgi:thiamine kinase-like enzyme